ncbi:MAG: FtsX-like permease family protein [Lawsonibacter sp.]|jgi:putative ABC transport system permease protein|nr:FtsX-like permease family protein [Lawsonibacter sp.]
MFSKLALRNVRRSFRDYGVYLLTLTFGVCLFYTFNSIDGQGAMAYLSRNKNPMVEPIMMLVDIFSVFVAVVLACLILYANRFLLRRRKRELGTYLLLGLSQGQVSRLLFLETGLIGIVSLAAGLALGVAASFGMSALTLSMFEINVSGMLALTFSPKAAGKTALYFGVIFLLVMALSGVQVSKSKLIDLIHGERKNEVLKPRPLGVAVFQFVLGVICLLAAYAILLIFGMALAVAIPFLCFPMLGLGTLGTLLIFRSLSGFVMKFVQSRPGLYFRDLHVFTLRQWISKVHTTYLAQTVVCILLLLAIGITASSLGLNSTLSAMTDGEAPFDITVQNQSGDTELIDFDALFRAGGFDPEEKLAWSYDTVFYYNEKEVTGIEDASGAIRVSDYDALMVRQGQSAYAGPLPALLEWQEEDKLATGNLGLACVVIPDDMAGQLEPRRQVWSADYSPEDKEGTERQLLELVLPLRERLSVRPETRLSIYADMVGNKILALFLGLYLGFTFLLAAAAVLALQQLSQGADNTGRYAVLRRLGAEEKQMKRSAVQQVALAFLLPLALALVHSAVGMKAANDIIATAGRIDSAASSLVTAGVLLAVYGGYFLATALACGRMAKNA